MEGIPIKIWSFKAIAVLWIAMLSIPALSQTARPTVKKTGSEGSIPIPNQKEPDRVPSAVQKRAVALLKSLFEASSSLADGTSKARLQARIGETLWSYDQRDARRAFDESLRSIDSVSLPNANNYPLLANQDVHFRSQLRREVAEIIAKVDSDWAKRIALSHIKIPDAKTGVRLDFQSIMSLTESDPRRAAELLRENIDVKDATLVREVLTKIRPRQPALADDVFSYALSLAEKQSQPFHYFFEVFHYVFPDNRRRDESVAYASSMAASPIDDGLIRRFLEFGYRAIMQEAGEIEQGSESVDERAGYGYEYVLGMLPSFLPYMPEEAAKMRTRWDEVVGNLRGGKKQIKELNLLLDPPDVESLLREANQAKKPEDKTGYYLLAAYRALSDANFNRAFAILDKIPDEEERRRHTDTLRIRAAEIALEKGDLDNAYRYGKEIVEPYQRTETMNRLLLVLVEKKDNTRATSILEEALQKVAKDDDVLNKVTELLSFAEIATRLNPRRGFEVMKLAIEAINNARMSDGSAYRADLTEFDKSLLPLARIDFEKSLTLAHMLNDGNLLWAQLAICRGALTVPGQTR